MKLSVHNSSQNMSPAKKWCSKIISPNGYKNHYNNSFVTVGAKANLVVYKLNNKSLNHPVESNNNR